jgi:thioredoxin reductase/Pyruvate/2-oxoacid:ferredoxin oxidoreductase delta subunit
MGETRVIPDEWMQWAVYLGALLAVWVPYGFVRRRGSAHSRAVLAESRALGLLEPASLHPKIDESECIGCASCAAACPEQDVLGVIDGKARLVRAANCIGHGACARACPVGAIQLVFGTETRGVEIPLLAEDFQTNVPGLFIAGELGGMGLIRNAVEQGRQAVEQIHARRPRGGAELDLVIVGAGPAGFAASLAAMERRMKFATLEQESLGGCVFQYPRGKIVMTQPARLPIVGDIRLRTTSKEELLELWRAIERKVGLRIRCGERVEGIARAGDGFVVRSSGGEQRARSVLLAIGRRGTPRKLGVEGEDLPKVTYRLIEPEQYAGRHVLVVGGGDSALEAAASIAETGSAGSVVLSYRGDAFSRAKPRNRERIAAAEHSGRLHVMLKSQVEAIEPQAVTLKAGEGTQRFANDAVIVSAGGILPGDFLRSIGIEIETKYGTA